MLCVILLFLAPFAAAQQHYSIVDNGGVARGVMVHDWNTMPNIVNNILNAHWGHNRGNARPIPPGLIMIAVNQNVGGGQQIILDHTSGISQLANLNNPLHRATQGSGSGNRENACSNGYTYCAERFLRDRLPPPLGGSGYVTQRPPLVGTSLTSIVGGQMTVRLRNFNKPGYTSDIMKVGTVPYVGGQVGLPIFYSCDEYPFASSANGGGSARLSCVPDLEQEIQRQVTGRFYTGCTTHSNAQTVKTGFGQPFYTAVVNVPEVIYDMLSTTNGIPDFCDVSPIPVRGQPGIPTEISCL